MESLVIVLVLLYITLGGSRKSRGLADAGPRLPESDISPDVFNGHKRVASWWPAAKRQLDKWDSYRNILND